MSEFDLTHHAWTRYSDHYPAATEADVLREVEAAEEINRSVGDVLRGRFSTAKHDISVYRLHRQRTGMFLVDGPVVVTYFRFEISQHRQAVRMYGEGAPVDECVPWAWLVRPELEEVSDEDTEPPPTGRTNRTAILGVPIENIHLSAGAGKRWRGKLVLREALRDIELVPPAQADAPHQRSIYYGRVLEPAFMMRAPDGSWAGIYLDRDEVRVMVPTPTPQDAEEGTAPPPAPSQEPRTPKPVAPDVVHPLTGGRVGDIRIAGPLLEAYLGRATMTGGEASKARRAIRTLLMSAQGIADGDGRWLVELRFPEGTVEALLFQRPTLMQGEAPEWWLLHCEPYEPSADHVVLAKLLHRAGWTVFAPVWVDAAAQEAS